MRLLKGSLEKCYLPPEFLANNGGDAAVSIVTFVWTGRTVGMCPYQAMASWVCKLPTCGSGALCISPLSSFSPVSNPKAFARLTFPFFPPDLPLSIMLFLNKILLDYLVCTCMYVCVCCICVHTCHSTVHGDQRTTFQILQLQILVTLPGFFPDFKDEVMFFF